jgi:hypothetical protein
MGFNQMGHLIKLNILKIQNYWCFLIKHLMPITYLPPTSHCNLTTYLPTYHPPTYLHTCITYVSTHLFTYILPTYPLTCMHYLPTYPPTCLHTYYPLTHHLPTHLIIITYIFYLVILLPTHLPIYFIVL